MEAFQIFTLKNLKPAHFQLSRFIFMGVFISLIFSKSILKAAPQNPIISDKYQIIKDCKADWLVFDKQYNDYVPYFANRHFNYQSFSQYLDIENYKGYKLFIHQAADCYLFINGNYVQKLQKGKSKVMDVDSLNKKYKNPAKLLFTIYTSQPNIEDFDFLVIHLLNKSISPLFGTENDTYLKPRFFSNFNNFAILFSILLLSFVTFFNNFQNNLLAKYFNVRDLFTLRKRTDALVVNRPFDITNILFLVLLSFAISLILLIIEYSFTSILPKELINSFNPTFFTLVGQFFNLSFLTFVAFLVKYVLISLIANLYQLEKIVNLHFFKNLQSTGIFASILILFLFLLLAYPTLSFSQNKNIYLAIFSIFYFLRLVFLFFIIIKATPIKNLYLFSYLCIVELIPLFIGMKFAF